jgi:hypothetical protein
MFIPFFVSLFCFNFRLVRHPHHQTKGGGRTREFPLLDNITITASARFEKERDGGRGDLMLIDANVPKIRFLLDKYAEFRKSFLAYCCCFYCR